MRKENGHRKEKRPKRRRKRRARKEKEASLSGQVATGAWGRGQRRAARNEKSTEKGSGTARGVRAERCGIPEVRGTVNARGSTAGAALDVVLSSEKVLLMLPLIDAVLDTAPAMIVMNAARVTASALTRKIRSMFIGAVGREKKWGDFFQNFSWFKRSSRGSTPAHTPLARDAARCMQPHRVHHVALQRAVQHHTAPPDGGKASE